MSFVKAYEPLSKQKAPKVLADAITWVNTALTDFGISGVSLRGLIEFLKTALQNSNAAVRTSATKALVTVKIFAGSSKPVLCSSPSETQSFLQVSKISSRI
jgi:cytoskeleton-associated protein 5